MVCLSFLNNLWIIIFILFGGEPAVSTLSFAAALGKVSILFVFLAGFFTAFLGDILWFLLIKKYSKNIFRFRFIKKSYKTFINLVKGIETKNYFWLMFYSRFI